jgi:hypothetical protein
MSQQAKFPSLAANLIYTRSKGRLYPYVIKIRGWWAFQSDLQPVLSTAPGKKIP